MEQVETPNGEQTPANAELVNAADTKELDPAQLKATNERLLAESKKNREAYLKSKQELDRKESEYKAKLEQDGKYKELYEKSAADLANLKKQNMFQTVQNQLRSAAEKAGFVKPDTILKFGNQNLLTHDEESGAVYGIDAFIESVKQELPQLFTATKTPVINPMTPNGNLGNRAKSLKELSTDEIMAQLRALK